MRQGLVLHLHCRRPRSRKSGANIDAADTTRTRFLQHRDVWAAQFARKSARLVPKRRDGVCYLQYGGGGGGWHPGWLRGGGGWLFGGAGFPPGGGFPGPYFFWRQKLA